jgi:hypothetical protein
MSEKTVVLAEFSTPIEAHLALGRLKAASIRGFVSGDEPNAANFSLFGRMQYAPIQLHVPESQAEQASQILRSLAREQAGQGEEKTDGAGGGWTCHLCDTLVEDEQATVCPDCGEPRKERGKKKPPDVSSLTSVLPEPEGPSPPQDRSGDAEGVEPGRDFGLSAGPVLVEQRWDHLGWRYGFRAGFFGVMLLVLLTILLGAFRSLGQGLLAVLWGCLCVAPIAGLFVGLFGANLAVLISFVTHLFRGRKEFEERAVETAMDEHDIIARRWGDDSEEDDSYPREVSYPEEKSLDDHVQAPEGDFQQ